jgi:hypothetical protein
VRARAVVAAHQGELSLGEVLAHGVALLDAVVHHGLNPVWLHYYLDVIDDILYHSGLAWRTW